MKNLTLSEKYTLLAMNDKKKLNFLLSLQNGVYMSGVLELVKEKVVTNLDAIKVAPSLTTENKELKELHAFLKENQGKPLHKVIKSLMGPFESKTRKKVKSDVLASLESKVFSDQALEVKDEVVSSIVIGIKEQMSSTSDIDAIILAKLLVEFKILGRYFDKDDAKRLKAYLKYDNNFNAELKEMIDIMNSLAAVGALAGAGAI